MADLSLTDALTDSVPDTEDVVERDFVATLEAESFDDQVGETVGKTNFVPLLDNDGKGESDLTQRKHHLMMSDLIISSAFDIRCCLFSVYYIDATNDIIYSNKKKADFIDLRQGLTVCFDSHHSYIYAEFPLVLSE